MEKLETRSVQDPKKLLAEAELPTLERTLKDMGYNILSYTHNPKNTTCTGEIAHLVISGDEIDKTLENYLSELGFNQSSSHICCIKNQLNNANARVCSDCGAGINGYLSYRLRD